MNPQQLQDLADIRELKARHFRRTDTQQWVACQTCFTEEVWV
jgi:SnoaL-like domain